MNLDLESPYLVKPVPGFTPVIGHLVSMMHYVRTTTLKEVGGLTTEQLDYLFDDRANSVGMLLEHMASVEEYYQRDTLGWAIEGGEYLERWRLGAELGEAGRKQIRGHPLSYYLDRLESVRDRTLEEFTRRDDAWLFEEGTLGGRKSNNYFKWFHVVEDEINHLGQIRVTLKRFPAS